MAEADRRDPRDAGADYQPAQVERQASQHATLQIFARHRVGGYQTGRGANGGGEGGIFSCKPLAHYYVAFLLRAAVLFNDIMGDMVDILIILAQWFSMCCLAFFVYGCCVCIAQVREKLCWNLGIPRYYVAFCMRLLCCVQVGAIPRIDRNLCLICGFTMCRILFRSLFQHGRLFFFFFCFVADGFRSGVVLRRRA